MDRVDRAAVFFHGIRCGTISRIDGRYRFAYTPEYLARSDATPLSRSLPLRAERFEADHLFPYFAGLVSEGWLLRQQSVLERIDPGDYLTLLAHNGEDLAGAVTVKPIRGQVTGAIS